MKKLLLTLLFGCSLIGFSHAQDSFFSRFSLRKSFESKADKAEAASFTFNKPKDTAGSWAADIGLGYKIFKETELEAVVEFHKNTLVSKKQDSRDFGLTYRRDFFSLAKFTPFMLVSTKYNLDKEKGNESFRGSLSFSLKTKDLGLGGFSFILPNKIVPVGKAFTFEYAPYLGLENENRTKTENALGKGHIYRWYFQVVPVITLFPETSLADRFELRCDYQYRNDFKKSVQEIASREHEFFTASFNYNILKDVKDKKFQVGLDYVKGENPTGNFESQSYYALSLKLKL